MSKVHPDFTKLQDLIKDNDAKFIDFRFTDLDGKWHHITKSSDDVGESVLRDGLTFDGSSVKGWKPIEDSDMYFIPDLSTAFIDPFSSQVTVVVTCDVYDSKTGLGYDKDPRTVAKMAERFFLDQNVGDAAYFGPEPEFFIFDDVRFKVDGYTSFYHVKSSETPCQSDAAIEGGNLAHRPVKKGGYFPVGPVDHHFDIRCEMVSVMKEVGVKANLHHHEVATSQSEIGFEFSTLTATADNIQKYKYVVKNVAHAYGKTATFLPKPIFGDNGSGMHVHQSIWNKGINLFKGDQEAGLSETALYYIGGIIKHARAINAFTNPTTNSYKRLVPGYEAPTFLAYSKCNRSAAIRIPYATNENGRRIEARFPDPLANPYLGLAAMLLAGLDGIKNKIHPGHARNENLYELSDEDGKSVPRVCKSLDEALSALDSDREFLKAGGVFSDALIDSYIALKYKEFQTLSSIPHPAEFEMYYSG